MCRHDKNGLSGSVCTIVGYTSRRVGNDSHQQIRRSRKAEQGSMSAHEEREKKKN
jgi:hypothetical protein